VVQIFLDAITEFVFKYPSYMIDSESATGELSYDSDDDLNIDRNGEGTLIIGTELSIILYHCIYSEDRTSQNTAYPRNLIWLVCKYGGVPCC